MGLVSCHSCHGSQGYVDLDYLHVVEVTDGSAIGIQHNWHELLPPFLFANDFSVSFPVRQPCVQITHIIELFRGSLQWISILKEVSLGNKTGISEQMLDGSLGTVA